LLKFLNSEKGRILLYGKLCVVLGESRSDSFKIASRVRAKQLRSHGLIPGRRKIKLSFPNSPHRIWCPLYFSMDTGVLYLGTKRQAWEPDHFPPSSADTDIAIELYFHSSEKKKNPFGLFYYRKNKETGFNF
jgi:hypothetical protein